MKHLAFLSLTSCLSFVVLACHIPDVGSIDLSGCFHGCAEQSKTACDAAGTSDTTGHDCFDDIEACFNAASDCSDACLECSKTDSCVPSTDECNNSCVHMANDCTQMIKPCVKQRQDEVVNGVVDDITVGCIDPLMDCVSSCVDDAQSKLKGG